MTMIRVVAGNNAERKPYNVPNTKTIREFLEQDANIDYTRGSLHLDGATLQPGDIDKTFESLGITSSCYLFNVVKADNAQW